RVRHDDGDGFLGKPGGVRRRRKARQQAGARQHADEKAMENGHGGSWKRKEALNMQRAVAPDNARSLSPGMRFTHIYVQSRLMACPRQARFSRPRYDELGYRGAHRPDTPPAVHEGAAFFQCGGPAPEPGARWPGAAS